MLFKSEAIVHPDDVIKYISSEECQLSYNPLLMALLWNSLATYEVRLLRQALQERFRLPPGTTWVNYVRCHDDIGWTFSDEDAARLNINGTDHRRFLNDFYTGRFPGSFARGLPFQFNPATGDCRISGTCASLAGLEKALYHETETSVELAIQRILLIHGVILTIGGIPLLYLGDELGMLNDYSYRDDPDKAPDSRWVHRPALNTAAFDQRHDPGSPPGLIYQGLLRLIRLRKSQPAFSNGEMETIALENPRVLGYLRTSSNSRILVFCNFTDRPQIVPAEILRIYGLAYQFTDLLTGHLVSYADLTLQPYQFTCLAAGSQL